MKKKIFGGMVVVAIAVCAMINVNLNKVSNKGDLALANVQTLANAEDPPGGADQWFKFGNYVEVIHSGTTVTVTVDVIVKGVKIGVTTKVETGESYTTWECKGWGGNC